MTDQTVTYLLMVHKLLNSKQKILKLKKKILILKKLDYLDMFLILVLIMMLLQLVIY